MLLQRKDVLLSSSKLFYVTVLYHMIYDHHFVVWSWPQSVKTDVLL